MFSSATGLEDSLRQKINVQIESFRASVQQTICQEFDLYQHSVALAGLSSKLPSPSRDTGVNYYQVLFLLNSCILVVFKLISTVSLPTGAHCTICRAAAKE